MAASTLAMTQSAQQLFAKQQHVSSRAHTCAKPSAMLCRPGLRFNVRPAAFRRGGQCNPQGSAYRWSGGCGPKGVYWNMGGPQTVKTLNELWKELERVNSQVEGGRWNNQSKNDEEANVRPLAVDIEEDDDGYTLTADVPGLSKEDLKVQVDKDRFLTISGERKRVEADGKEDSKYKERSQYERKFGKFSRKLKLPDDADMECISARVDAGVLYLSIRRAEDLKPVDVPIY